MMGLSSRLSLNWFKRKKGEEEEDEDESCWKDRRSEPKRRGEWGRRRQGQASDDEYLVNYSSLDAPARLGSARKEKSQEGEEEQRKTWLHSFTMAPLLVLCCCYTIHNDNSIDYNPSLLLSLPTACERVKSTRLHYEKEKRRKKEKNIFRGCHLPHETFIDANKRNPRRPFKMHFNSIQINSIPHCK